MNNFFELIQYPFVQRAILAGIFAGGLLAVLGIFVVLRKMSFMSEGLAHASLTGVAIGLLTGQAPLAWAIVFCVVFALIIFALEQKANLAPDSLIGILFTTSLALGILLINLKSGYQPDLMSFLFGNILTIQETDVWIIIGASVLITSFVIFSYKQYLFVALNENMAKIAGIGVNRARLTLYVILAIAIVLGIKMLGIVLVSALLIMPVSTAKLVSGSAKSLLAVTIVASEIIVLAGMFLSLLFNLPTGSMIVLTGSFLFLIVFLITYGKHS